MLMDYEDYLAHYGIPRKSGRYPWGSGEEPYQSSRSFVAGVREMRSKGLTDAQIAEGLGMTTKQLVAYRTIALNEAKAADVSYAQRLKDKGMSNTEIGRRMGINESSVRSLLKPGADHRADVLTKTSDMLKREVADKEFIDIGVGVENQLGLARTRLDSSIAMLEAEGYTVHNIKVDQLGTGEKTTVKVLAPPGTEWADVVNNKEKIKQVQEFSDDGGVTYNKPQKPVSVDADRLGINYGGEGGELADGVIYLRRGVDDLSMGDSNYAQVRIGVNDTHYIKGMAIYKDDLPDGVDLVFNTNKARTDNALDVLKPMKTDANGDVDWDNPFGSSIKRQIIEADGDGNPKVTSALNIVNEEGDWSGWSKNLASQMLSKQSLDLAETQLNLTRSNRQAEFDEIMALTNPTVKKKLLDSFAETVDASAVHLEAAAMPRQTNQVILPVNSLKDTEVYAPNYRNGERVALVRYPHGGTFEIPELVVNNRNPDAKSLLGNATDAIAINASVAERLSGADFDGDSVVVIPNNSRRVKSTKPLEGLKDFDPQVYKIPEDSGIPRMTARQKGMEMGKVSNLITDMTIRGADTDEIAKAVRHSMVVIDAEKHGLDYKQSARDNNIADLSERYQGKSGGGASTLISRATAEKRVNERKDRPASEGGPVDPETGRRMYVETGNTYTNAAGKTVRRTTQTTQLADTDDAYTLSSGSAMESVYANHSNQMKALANKARKASHSTETIKYSPSAKKAYEPEVRSLDSKLNEALKNAPKERQAQIVGNQIVATKRSANPNLTGDDLKKVKGQALVTARARTGAGKKRVEISDREWEAVQAGAISNSKLTKILNNSDMDSVRKHATPRNSPKLTSAREARAKSLIAAGYTQAEVADALGVSTSTINNIVNG